MGKSSAGIAELRFTNIAIHCSGMSKKRLALTFLFLIFLLNGSLAQRFKDYFPESFGYKYVYHWKFATNDKDTVKGTDTLWCISFPAENDTAFYFDKKRASSQRFIGSNMFGAGTYLYIGDQLYLSIQEDENTLEQVRLSSFKMLFPTTLQKNSTYSCNFDPCIRKFTFTGFEDVIIEGKKLENCMAIDTEEIWPNKKYKGKLWFYKGFGLVKWIRPTGRVEEIDIKQLFP